MKKYFVGHRCQTGVGGQAVVSQWFSSHSPEFCAEGMHFLITLDKCVNLQGDSIQSRSFFSFCVGNVILNKNVDKKANTRCVFLLSDQPTQKIDLVHNHFHCCISCVMNICIYSVNFV